MPSGSLPVKQYNIKKWKTTIYYKKKLKSTIQKAIILDYKRILYKNVIEISNSNTTLYAIYKLLTNVI